MERDGLFDLINSWNGILVQALKSRGQLYAWSKELALEAEEYFATTEWKKAATSLKLSTPFYINEIVLGFGSQMQSLVNCYGPLMLNSVAEKPYLEGNRNAGPESFVNSMVLRLGVERVSQDPLGELCQYSKNDLEMIAGALLYSLPENRKLVKNVNINNLPEGCFLRCRNI
jgi:hypothetical protein